MNTRRLHLLICVWLLSVSAAYQAAAYYNPGTGRWLNRDPIEEQGDENVYRFAENDPANQIDYIGLWTKPARKGEAWAKTCAQQGDTWQALAEKLRLDQSEASKWVHNYDEVPIVGKSYEIPNTVAVYTSKLGVFDSLNIFGIVKWMQGFAYQGGKHYEEKGYRAVYHLERSSESDFEELWKTDGIFAFAFGGHGSKYGFIAATGSDTAVDPSQVSPPYKLQAIGAYSCNSADPIPGSSWPAGALTMPLHSWKEYVAPNGTFIGSFGWVNWFNVRFREEVQNPGYIPE